MICTLPSTKTFNYLTNDLAEKVYRCYMDEVGQYTPILIALESQRFPIAFINGEIIYSPKTEYQELIETLVNNISKEYIEKYSPFFSLNTENEDKCKIQMYRLL